MSLKDKRLAVEIGGTFTDIILFEEQNNKVNLKTLKTPSTPKQPERGVIQGVDKLQEEWGDTGELLHGSTVATNAVLERKGFNAALLVTEGFADILEIQRGDKENIYDLFYQRSLPVIPRNHVYSISERLTHEGAVLIPIDEEQVRAAAESMKAENITSVGICFLHSYASSVHEMEAKKIIESVLPDALVITSSEILPQFREYERASTTAITAYIAPVMVRYMETLQAELKKRRFLGEIMITQSNGGVIPMSALRKEVARTLLSGPAAGVTGAAFMAKQSQIEDIITLDIGGTSADVCLVNKGTPLVSTENKIDGLAVAVPMLDIVTVGAGGGSIAWLDEGNMLRVGPQSAGADPGPACYGRGGTQPTVTDAHVYRGFIRPGHFAGGTYSINSKESKHVIGQLADKIGSTLDEAAEAIIRIMEANTIQAIRLVSTERGYDARNYTLVAFGGAGALHAANLADDIGMEKVLIPRYAGILSSFGLLVADIIRDTVQTHVSLCGETDESRIKYQFERIKEKALKDMEMYGVELQDLQFKYVCDVRYQGQAFELQVDINEPFPSGQAVAGLFHEAHLQRYGFNSLKEQVEIVNYRLKTIIPRNNKALEKLTYLPEYSERIVEEEKVLIDGKWIRCLFYNWASLSIGAEISGPAIVEENTSTCYIPKGWIGRVQNNGSLLLTKEV